MKHRSITLSLAVVLAGSLACAGCGSEPSTKSAGAAASSTGAPIEVRNCGRTLRFAEPPTRIVSGWPSSTELLIALGAAGKVVGKYNTESGDVGAEFAARDAEIPTLGTGAPSREALLKADPDLIWADGDYLFDGKQLPTIPELNRSGIQVMILSGFCTGDATGARISDLDTDAAALGALLDAPEKARGVTARADRSLAAVAARIKGRPRVPVAMISIFDGTTYAYEGVYSDMARLAGGRNIYSGVLPRGKYFGEVSTEDLTRRDPATVVYLTAAGESATTARSSLARAFPTLTAVRRNQVAVLPQVASTNLRGVEGVTALAAALHPTR